MKRKILALILALSFLTNSCTSTRSFSEEDPVLTKLREQGYDLSHINSCGPKALSNLLAKFNEKNRKCFGTIQIVKREKRSCISQEKIRHFTISFDFLSR